MIILLIIFCEIGFWMFLFTGLFVRYQLKKDKLSRVLLLCVPILDVILLSATFIDLNRGAEATFAHGLATAYLGFTLVFGKEVVNWADHKMGGKVNEQVTLTGFSYALYEWKVWGRGVLACAIAACLLFLGIELVDQPQRTGSLNDWYYILVNLMVLWAVFGPLWYTIFPKKSKPTQNSSATPRSSAKAL